MLAGLVVLGTVLSAVAVARGRFLRQFAQSEQKLRATKAIEPLLTQWLAAQPQNLRVPDAGPLPDSEGLYWRTRWVRDPAAGRVNAVVLRVDVVPTRDVTAIETRSPVLTVDLLLHDPRLTAAPAPPPGGVP